MDDPPGANGDDSPDGQLPYESWTEEAFRAVAVRALAHVAANGLPGEHHFYITFRVDHPTTSVPAHLRAKYPEEMTIVLQHKFWDLMIDEAKRVISVGLSFGGRPSTLIIPFDAMTGFADPSVKWGLRFRPLMPERKAAPGPRAVEPETAGPEGASGDEAAGEPQVVSLDAFRRRKD